MGEAATNAEGNQKPAEQPAQGGGTAPAPVPYAVFKQTNDDLKAAKDRVTALETELGQFGKAKFEETTTTFAKEKASWNTKLALAQSGVQSETYLDYLTDRYNKLPEQGRPDVKTWVGTLKSSEPAFFGSASPSAGSATTSPSQPTPAPTPKTNPDANAQPASSASPASDPPLTDDVIRTMSQADFERRYDEIAKYMARRKK